MARESLTKSLPGNIATKAAVALAFGTAIKLARTESEPVERIRFFGPDIDDTILAAVILRKNNLSALPKLTTDLDSKARKVKKKTGESSNFFLITEGSRDESNKTAFFPTGGSILKNCANVEVSEIAERQRELLRERDMRLENEQDALNPTQPEILTLRREETDEEMESVLKHFAEGDDPSLHLFGEAAVEHIRSLLQVPKLRGILVSERTSFGFYRLGFSYISEDQLDAGRFDAIAKANANFSEHLREKWGIVLHAYFANCDNDFDGFVQGVIKECNDTQDSADKVLVVLKFE